MSIPETTMRLLGCCEISKLGEVVTLGANNKQLLISVPFPLFLFPGSWGESSLECSLKSRSSIHRKAICKKGHNCVLPIAPESSLTEEWIGLSQRAANFVSCWCRQCQQSVSHRLLAHFPGSSIQYCLAVHMYKKKNRGDIGRRECE